MQSLSDSAIGSAGTRPAVDALFRMGYRTYVGTLGATTEAHYHNQLKWQPWAVRFRTRGAAASGPGTNFRNRHWVMGKYPAHTKHIPIPFKNDPGYETGSPVTGNVGVIVLQAVNRSETY